MRISLEVAALILCSAIVGTLLSALMSYGIFTVANIGDPYDRFEIFTRIALVVILTSVLLYFYLRASRISGAARYGVQVNVFLVVFGIGALAALLDPFTPIRQELNWIRYPTAIILTLAGLVLLRTALFAPRHPVYRVLGGGLGAVLIAAAADELFEFHEQVDGENVGLSNAAVDISGQDFVTLAVAVTAILVACVAFYVVAFFAKRGIFGTGGREVLAAKFIVAAGVSFLSAMLLDTFNPALSDLAHVILSPFFSGDHVLIGGGQLDGHVRTLANSMEEFLEMGAAVLLLAAAVSFRSETRESGTPVSGTAPAQPRA